MVKIPEEKFSYETICNSFLIFYFRERGREKKKKKICLQDIHLQTPREISMLIFDYISPTYIYVLVPIHVLKKSVKYQQLSIIMEQYFGSPCRFLNPHVKLTFGKRKKKLIYSDLNIDSFPLLSQTVSIRSTKLYDEIRFMDL